MFLNKNSSLFGLIFINKQAEKRLPWGSLFSLRGLCRLLRLPSQATKPHARHQFTLLSRLWQALYLVPLRGTNSLLGCSPIPLKVKK